MKKDKLEERRQRNKGVKTIAKNSLKSFFGSLNSNQEFLIEKLRKAQSALDKAKKKGVYHKNKISRKVSNIFKNFNSKNFEGK